MEQGPLPELEEARAIYDARVELYGEPDPNTLQALLPLVSLLRDEGENRQAESLLKSSLAAQQRSADMDVRLVTLTEFSLGLTLDRLGDYTAARRVWERVLESSDRMLGPDSDQSLRAAVNLAITLRKLRLPGDEFPLRVRVLESRERLLGADDAATLGSVIDLAQTHRELGDHQMALALFSDALAGLERSSDDHRLILYQKWAMASELVALKRRREASAMFDQVVQGASEHLDRDDPFRRSAIRQRRAYWLLGKLSRKTIPAESEVESPELG
jgi:tetratricopeptide (TPR) repeat protein